MAKREPLIAPSPTITALTAHHGMVDWMAPLPCMSADTSMAPKISPPGNRSHCRMTATRVEPATSTTSSMTEESKTSARGVETGSSPRLASATGNPAVRIMTRMVCTIAMPRRSDWFWAACAITCESAPGAEPNKADSVSQPCTLRR